MQVSFTNWHAGNVDPEDLKKHKELLHRQHYGGPFWEGRQKPMQLKDDYGWMKDFMDNYEEIKKINRESEIEAQKEKPGIHSIENVKR